MRTLRAIATLALFLPRRRAIAAKLVRVWCDNPSLDRETGAVTGSGGPAPSCHHLWAKGYGPRSRRSPERGRGDNGLVQGGPSHRAEEGRRPVGEHAAVRGDQPVAKAIAAGGHGDHGGVEVDAAGRAEEGSRETKDTSVARHQPVAACGVVYGQAHDGLVERFASL